MDKQHKVNTLRAYPIFLTNISADVLLELQGGLQLHDGAAVQELHQRVGAGAGRAALDPAGGYLDISVDISNPGDAELHVPADGVGVAAGRG